MKKFYTAKHDRVFKAIFGDVKNKHLTEALLSACLGEPVEITKYLNTELNVRNVTEKSKRLDMLLKAKDKNINVEVNSNFDMATRMRNLNYFAALLSKQTIRGERYDFKTEFVHIDFAFGLGTKLPPIMIYRLYSKEAKGNYVDNVIIIVINMDKIKEVWYSKDEELINKYASLLMIDLEREELEELGQRSEIVKEYGERLMELNENDSFIHEISPEDDARYLMNTRLELAEEQAIEKTKLENAKNLLLNHISDEIIIQSIGITLEQLEKLKKEI